MRQVLILFPFLIFLSSCEKESDQPSKGDAIFFDGYVETDVIFYVGGEPKDPTVLNVNQLWEWPEISWISSERYEGNYYYFMDDSVELYQSTTESKVRYGYFFSNDSLFLLHDDPWIGATNTIFAGIGDKFELRKKHCLIYARRYNDDGTVDRGGGFNVSDHYTLEDLHENFTEFTDISQMGPNDTLILYNQTSIYR